MRSAFFPVAALALCLAGCAGSSRKNVRTPAAAATQHYPDSAGYRQCAADLRQMGVRFQPLPVERRSGGCTIIDAVKLLDIGTPTQNLGAMTCPLAKAFAGWARYAVVPAARLYLHSEVLKIETFGTYACRTIRGGGPSASRRLSEHAHANAVDVAAFTLANGKRVSIVGDWAGDGPEALFLRRVRESACKRFRTVLSPDYNAAHHDHLHFDLGGKGTYCR